MYYKNYGINGELEKMFNSPVNKNVTLEENQRIIKLYRAFLLKDEKVMFECAGDVPKQKRRHTKLIKRYFDLRSIIISVLLVAGLALLLLLALNKQSRTVLIVMVLAFPVVYTTVVLIYWHLIDQSPDLEAIGKIKYLITDRRIIARHREDVDITDIDDIIYVIPEKRAEKKGNVIFATNAPDYPMIFGGAYQNTGIYMTRDYSTAFEIIRNLVIDRDRRREFFDENRPNKIQNATGPDRRYHRTIVTDYGEGLHKQKVNADMDELTPPDQLTLDALLTVDEEYKDSEE